MIDILLIKLKKYKVISFLKCKYVYFEQPSRASRAFRTTGTKRRGKKVQSSLIFELLMDFSLDVFRIFVLPGFLLPVGWSQTIGLSREEKSSSFGNRGMFTSRVIFAATNFESGLNLHSRSTVCDRFDRFFASQSAITDRPRRVSRISC